MILFRPVGMIELKLIYEASMKAFPPRLPEQPIFYPVLNFDYAAQIASRWNTKERDFAGYVTRFEVEDAYVSQFESHIVGGREHEELWVPAEQLEEFNQHIIGQIEVVAAYFGPKFEGLIAEQGNMKGRDAIGQFGVLSFTLDYNGVDFFVEVGINNTAVFLNYPYWVQHDFTDINIPNTQRERTLIAIEEVWEQRYPDLPLPLFTLE